MSDGGKGSGRRPGDGYQDGWDRIFGQKARTPRTQHALVGAESVQCVCSHPTHPSGSGCEAPAREEKEVARTHSV